jgi:hypothetical protein
MPSLRESSPAQRFAAVTPHASTNIASGPARALFVGVGGDLVAVALDDVAVGFKNIASGAVLPLAVKRVNAANTTATDIVALF